MNWLLSLFGFCRHRSISRVFSRVRGVSPGHYVICMDCYKRLRYDWASMTTGEELDLDAFYKEPAPAHSSSS